MNRPPKSIHVHIDELHADGLDDAAAVTMAESLKERLTELLSGSAAHDRQLLVRPPAGDAVLPVSSDARTLGAAAALAVHRSLDR